MAGTACGSIQVWKVASTTKTANHRNLRPDQAVFDVHGGKRVNSSSSSSTAADEAATKAIEEEILAIDEILKERKYSTSSNEISLPIFLVAEPGQDTIIFEAARSLLNRVD